MATERRIARVQIGLLDKAYTPEKAARGKAYAEELAAMAIQALSQPSCPPLDAGSGVTLLLGDGTIELGAKIVNEFHIPPEEEIEQRLRKSHEAETKVHQKEVLLEAQKKEMLALEQYFAHRSSVLDGMNKKIADGILVKETDELKAIRDEHIQTLRKLDDAKRETQEEQRKRDAAMKQKNAIKQEIKALKERSAAAAKTPVCKAAEMLVMLEPGITIDRAEAYLFMADKDNALTGGEHVNSNDLKSILVAAIQLYRDFHKA